MTVTNIDVVGKALPTAPDDLTYLSASFSRQHYTTTGAFEPGAKTRKRADLRWLGCIALDFDLVDYLAHTGAWSEVKADDRKGRMYRELAVPGAEEALASSKATHRAVVMDAILGASASLPGGALPTVVVDSGWGVHAYFWLAEGTRDETTIDVARTVNQLMVERINGAAGYELADKGVHDAGTRLLRVVGSLNTQAQEKAHIDAPMRVDILPELSSPEARWDIIETWRGLLAAAAEPARVEPSAANAPQASETAPEIELPAPKVAPAPSGDAQIDDLARTYRECLGYLLQGDKALLASYTDAVEKQDSETDMAFCCACAARRVPVGLTLMLLAYAVREHPNAHDGTDYYDRTVARAWQRVRGSEEMDPERNYRLAHPSALVRLRRGMSDMLIASAVAQHDPRLAQMLWVDQRTGKIEWEQDAQGRARVVAYHAAGEHPTPAETCTGWEFKNADGQRLCAWIEDVYGTNMLRGWRDALGFIATGLPSRNPVRDYLERSAASVEASPAWAADDSLLDTWLSRAFGVENTPLVRTISRKWLVGGAARGMNPGVFLKSMLVLVGGQSAGKTTMFRILGGDYYASPHTADLGSKDATIECGYSWLLEMEEMSFLAKSTLEHVKKYITTQTDRYRPVYGKEMETFHRGCFYGGSANTMDLLNDPTGADRFWCVALPDNAVCDFEFIRTYRDALWGLAARAWMVLRDQPDAVQGINLTRDELAMLRGSNRAFERTDAIEDTLLTAVWAKAINRNDAAGLRVTWEEIREGMFPRGDQPTSILRELDRNAENRIRTVLERHGFVLRRAWEDGRAGRRFWFAPQAWCAAHAAGLVPEGVGQPLAPIPVKGAHLVSLPPSTLLPLPSVGGMEH